MLILLVLLLLALLHACYGAVLAALARRLGSTRVAWAWLPVLNLLLPFDLAGRSLAWGALLPVPPLNVIVWVLAWAEVFARLGRPSWNAPAAAGALVLASLVAAGAAGRAGRPVAEAAVAPESAVGVPLEAKWPRCSRVCAAAGAATCPTWSGWTRWRGWASRPRPPWWPRCATPTPACAGTPRPR